MRRHRRDHSLQLRYPVKGNGGRRVGCRTGPTSALTNAATSTLPFAGLTLNGSHQQIYTSAAAAPSGTVTKVRYGIRADETVASGTYQQTFIYTATVEP